jgi:hypothetical protein
MRKRAGHVLFPEVLPVCNGRQQACERPLDGLTITIKGEHQHASHPSLSRPSYMRNLPPERADNPRSELAWMVAAFSYSKIAI